MAIVYDFKEHRATVLVEPFGGLIDMIVRSGIRPTNNLDIHEHFSGKGPTITISAYHYSHIILVYTIIIDWWLEQMGVLLQPEYSLAVNRNDELDADHFGTFSGLDSILSQSLRI